MAAIAYTETDERSIDIIRPLWEQLNERHRALSKDFSRHYEAFTFERRRDDLLNKIKGGRMHICLARDGDRPVGYCVSTLVGPAGEVDSIFVEERYRSRGIGDALMRNALAWMGSRGASAIRVSVGAGNEEVLPFYARYGFLKRMTTLERVEK